MSVESVTEKMQAAGYDVQSWDVFPQGDDSYYVYLSQEPPANPTQALNTQGLDWYMRQWIEPGKWMLRVKILEET